MHAITRDRELVSLLLRSVKNYGDSSLAALFVAQ